MPEAAYDSREATLEHIARVGELLADVELKLEKRAAVHDASKLEDPEKATFDEFTPLLKQLVPESPEYHEARRAMGSALDHHYAVNDHHPEHHEGGVHDMHALQLIEMLADWKAATERHDPPGDLRTFITGSGQKRFGYDDTMAMLLLRTAEHMGWA